MERFDKREICGSECLPEWLRLVIVLDHACLLALKVDYSLTDIELALQVVRTLLGMSFSRVFATEYRVARRHWRQL